MDKLTLAVVSRNYFNMPAWIAADAGCFAQEGLAVDIEHIDRIWLADTRASLEGAAL